MTVPVLSPQAAELLTRTLLHSIWQGAAVLAVVGVLWPWFRRWSSHGRYLVLVAAEIAIALLPVATLLSLSPGVPSVSPAPARIAARAEATVPSRIAHPAPTGTETGAPASDEASAQPSPTAPASAAAPLARTKALREKGAATVTAAPFDWRRCHRWIANLYFGGVLLMLARLAAAIAGGRQLVHQCQPLQNPWMLEALSRQARRAGLSFTPAVAVCARIAVPCVVGAVRPMLLLPVSLATSLPPDQVEMLLAHELAHIRRYDHLVNLVQRLIESFLFFHPVVWFLSARVRYERELCCDDDVLADGTREPTAYAAALLGAASEALRAARASRGALALGADGNGRWSEMGRRVHRLLAPDPRNAPPRLHNRAAFAVVGLSAALVLLLPLLIQARIQLLPPVSAPTAASRLLDLPGATRSPTGAVTIAGGGTALQKAAAFGTIEEIHALLAAGASVDARSSTGWTALHYAAAAGKVDVARALLQAGADVHARGAYNRTALHAATGLTGGGMPRRQEHTAAQMVDLLLKAGCPLEARENSQQMTALIAAAAMGNPDFVVALVAAGATVDARDAHQRTALALAAGRGDLVSVKTLLAAHADPNLPDEDGLLAFDRFAMRKPMIRIGDADAQLRDALAGAGARLSLCGAAALGQLDEVKRRLDTDPSLLRATPPIGLRGWTPLHWAAANGHADVCRELLRRGAVLDAVSAEGQTPLMSSMSSGTPNAETIRLLIESGSNLRLGRESGSTPLHLAAWRGWPDITALLLERGADPAAATNSGRTALHAACEPLDPDSVDDEAHLNTIRLLLHAGCSPLAATDRQVTPLSLAIKSGKQPLIDLLRTGSTPPARSIDALPRAAR